MRDRDNGVEKLTKQALRIELAEYFEAPAPKGKRAFVRRFGMPEISLSRMVFMQARYISKWVWLFSAVFFGMVIYIAAAAEPRFLNAIYACIPFLVMLSVTETTRSYRHGMEELEMSARFSLKSIMLARMVMLGLGNLVVLLGTMLLLGDLGQGNGAYALTPYFLTAGGGLCIVRRVRGNESVFLCMGLAGLISGMILFLPLQFNLLFTSQYSGMWVLVCVLGIFVTVRESYRTIRMAENCGG